MGFVYASDDAIIRRIKHYDQSLVTAIRDNQVLRQRGLLCRQARQLQRKMAGYTPPAILTNLFFQQALHCLWDLVNYLNDHQHLSGGRKRRSVYDLYMLKHRLLERMVVLAESCPVFTWEAGRASDSVQEISIRLTLKALNGQQRHKRVHWTIAYVPVHIQAIMQQRYGCFPPSEILRWRDE